MNYYLFRHYMELFYLMMSHEISVKQLADEFMMNLKTINKDISFLENLGPYYGIKIVYKDDKITYKVENRGLFEKKYRHCCFFYEGHRHNTNDYLFRISYIARRFLLSSNYITHDILSDELNYSKSNLRLEIQRVKEFLESYNIRLKNSPYHGSIAEGDEFNIRTCLISLINFIDPFVFTFNGLADFETKTGIMDEKSRQLVLNAINYNLSKYRLFLSEDRKAMLMNYIFIQNYRFNMGFTVSDWKDYYEVDFVRSTVVYQAAKSIYGMLGLYEVENTDSEIMGLAMLLLVWEDYFPKYSTGFAADKFHRTTEEIYSLIVEYLHNQWGIVIEDRELLMIMFSELYRLVLKYEFNMLKNHEMIIYGPPKPYVVDAVIARITNGIISKLEEVFGVHILYTQVVGIIGVIDSYFDSIRFKCSRSNIVITSFKGITFANFYKKKLLNYIDSKLFREITCINYDNVSDSCMNSGLVISDYIIEEKRTGCRYYAAANGFSKKELSNIRRLLMDNLSINEYGPEFIKRLNIFAHSVKEILTALFTEIGEIKSSFELEELYGHFIQYGNARNYYRNTMYLVIDSHKVKRDCLVAGNLEPSIKMGKNIVSRYIAVVLNPNPYKMKLYSVLFKALGENSCDLDKLLDEKSIDTLKRIATDNLY